MSKKLSNRFGFIFGVSAMLLLCMIVMLPINAKADAFWDNGELYELQNGENNSILAGIKPYNDETGEGGIAYFKFTLEEKSNIKIHAGVLGSESANGLNVYSEDERKVVSGKDFIVISHNDPDDLEGYEYFCTRILNPGTYYMEVYNWTDENMMFGIAYTAEAAVKLNRPEITSLTNSKTRTMEVKYKAVKKRTGYQIEYAEKSNFKNAKRVSTGATSKAIGKLNKGKTYYVRVRAYTVYSTGNVVYSPWSQAQAVQIKK